jgi:hypothetical protein
MIPIQEVKADFYSRFDQLHFTYLIWYSSKPNAEQRPEFPKHGTSNSPILRISKPQEIFRTKQIRALVGELCPRFGAWKPIGAVVAVKIAKKLAQCKERFLAGQGFVASIEHDAW